MQCGLLGRKLGHSYSPQIHSLLGDYSYALFEKEPEEVADFLKHGDFHGLNVTIPYKQAVIPYLDELSPIAEELGAVNTIVRRPDGKLVGHNTDYFGFAQMVQSCNLSLSGKKALVLGTGGASKPVVAVLQSLGAEVVTISRRGENHYGNLHRHADAALIVNTTPVGMYPNNGSTPLSLAEFPRLEGVLDIIFNPARTQLLLDAEARGLVARGGLLMLVAQAKEAAQWFTGQPIAEEAIHRIHALLSRQTQNIVLIGMPGCGKSTVGALLAEALNRPFVDADREITTLAGKSIPDIFAQDGEAAFRNWETQALEQLSKQSGLVIATGGGCVTQRRNYPLLHQNGRIFWLQRELDQLPTDGRPLSQSTAVEALYASREPLYRAFADKVIENSGTPRETVSQILRCLEEDA